MTAKYPDLHRLRSLLEYRDGHLYWLVNRGSYAGTRAGSLAKHGYIHVCVDRKVYLAHRLIWLLVYGELPEAIDHINGNRSDNRVENLRACTQADNNKNVSISKANKSGFKNVSWYAPYGKWRVTVRINGRQKNCGYFDDIDLADLVAHEARNKFHGEFARHA